MSLGIATTLQAFETYSRLVVFLILSSLFLAEGLCKHGMARRLALNTLLASRGVVPKILLRMMAILSPAALLSVGPEMSPIPVPPIQ